MHISNLFKLNNLIKRVDFEKISLPELKEHYVRIKSFKNDQKILCKLPDKGEKYLKRLKNIEEVIVKRCAELENKEKTEVKQETDLTDLLDKFQNILIEKKKDTSQEDATLDSKEDVKSNTLINSIKDEQLRSEITADIDSKENKMKIQESLINKEKTKIKTENEQNYFAKASNDDKLAEKLKYKQIKEKILMKKATSIKYPQAKTIPLDECFLLLKEHEKRVQEYQLQQTANRLLQGKTASYHYEFTKKTKDNLRYREEKADNSDESTDSEDEDNGNDYYDDDDGQNKIDRLHYAETYKNKFKVNEQL